MRSSRTGGPLGTEKHSPGLETLMLHCETHVSTCMKPFGARKALQGRQSTTPSTRSLGRGHNPVFAYARSIHRFLEAALARFRMTTRGSGGLGLLG